MNYKGLFNLPNYPGGKIFGDYAGMQGASTTLSGIYVNNLREISPTTSHFACYDDASFFLKLIRGESNLGYRFYREGIYSGYVNIDQIIGNKIDSVFMPFLNTFISQDTPLSSLKEFAKVAFGNPDHINDIISPYPMNKTTIMHYLDNEFLTKLIYNPAKFIACDSFTTTEASEVSEESFGADDAEQLKAVLRKAHGRILADGVTYQKYTRLVLTVSDLLNEAGFAPRLRLLILYRLLEILERKLPQITEEELPDFFKNADLERLKEETRRKINDLDREDHEGLFRSKTDYGQKLILQTLPVFRILFGHPEYNVLANNKQDSWWKVITDKLKLAFGISQFKIIKTYVDRLQDEYAEDYEEFVNHQARREKHYRFNRMKEDFQTGVLYWLAICFILTIKSIGYGIFTEILLFCLNLSPYAFGTIILYILMEDYDLGTGKTCRSTFQLIYYLLKITFFEAALVMLTAYSAISLILSTPFYLFKSMLFHEKQTPVSASEDHPIFSYDSWLDFSLSILEFCFSSLILAWGINLLPFHALYLVSPLVISLSIEALRKGPGLIYYKLNNHYAISSHFILEKLNRAQHPKLTKYESWMPEFMSNYFNCTV